MARDDAAGPVRVEVAFATRDDQVLIEVSVQEGTTVEQAIGASGLYRRFPDRDLRSCAVGVWGTLVDRERQVRDGDRIELYRPLLMDPREARRLRAKD